MGQAYILFLIFFMAIIVLWSGIRIVMRFILSQYISIQNDKLSIMAIKNPDIGRDREYNFAMLASHANMAAANIGSHFLCGQYYLDIDASIGKSFGGNHSALSVSKMKDAQLRSMVTKSSFGFVMLLIFGSWNEIKTFLSCLFSALKQAKSKRTPFSVAVIDTSSQISQSIIVGMGYFA